MNSGGVVELDNLVDSDEPGIHAVVVQMLPRLAVVALAVAVRHILPAVAAVVVAEDILLESRDLVGRQLAGSYLRSLADLVASVGPASSAFASAFAASLQDSSSQD